MEDPKHRNWLAVRLRTLGCQVFCAANLDEAAELVRAGLPSDLLLLHLGADCLSAPLLHAEMARRVPGWKLSPWGGFEWAGEDEIPEPRRLVN